jgi:hypothetical protein
VTVSVDMDDVGRLAPWEPVVSDGDDAPGVAPPGGARDHDGAGGFGPALGAAET